MSAYGIRARTSERDHDRPPWFGPFLVWVRPVQAAGRVRARLGDGRWLTGPGDTRGVCLIWSPLSSGRRTVVV